MNICEILEVSNHIQRDLIKECFNDSLSFSTIGIVSTGDRYCVYYDAKNDLLLFNDKALVLLRGKRNPSKEITRLLLHALIIKYMRVNKVKGAYFDEAPLHDMHKCEKNGKFHGEAPGPIASAIAEKYADYESDKYCIVSW